MNIDRLNLPGMSNTPPLVIAGPCSAESRDQVLKTAEELSLLGVKVFRAGIWKPRTKPGGFEGMGSVALPWLKEAKDRYGMLIATEVATEQHISEALKWGIDILWVGARSVANPFAMQSIADSLRGIEIPVLIKNPVNPDIELWIGAVERLYNAGVKNIGVVHRGFSTYDQKFYRNLPIWHIPIEFRRRFPNITMFCDPSHIGGKRDLIPPICQQAMELNFDGLMIEAHYDPNSALSDAKQQITPTALNHILKGIIVGEQNQTTERISLLRQQIDELDEQILTLLSKRANISKEIGRYKKENRIAVLQSNRYGEILKERVSRGVELNLEEEFVTSIMKSIHEESVRIQLTL